MRIVVLGSRGQLGRDLVPRLPGEVIPLTRAEIDLAQPQALVEQLAALKPDIVINCAAYNLVDKAETEPDLAWRVNAIGVRDLARASQTIGARFVHFSTDYVFGLDSARSTPLGEETLPGPVSVYGASKLAGEQLALAANSQTLVIRTCGLYGVWGSGGKGGNFVETMLRLAGQGKPLKVVDDQHCTPTSTVDLAETTVKLLATGATGRFHITNTGATTWFHMAREIFRQSQLNVDLTPISSVEFNAPALRPAYSVLDCAKLAGCGMILPKWHDALEKYLMERRSRAS
jgi:dTDP-4-dehydrorhamnose reductase